MSALTDRLRTEAQHCEDGVLSDLLGTAAETIDRQKTEIDMLRAGRDKGRQVNGL